MADERTQRTKYFILLLVVVVSLFSLGLSNHGLWSADEPRVAEIGREMALNGNWAVPTLNQRPFLEEPPLYYGALALTFKAFGVSDKVARIPSAFFAFATVAVMFFLANFFFGPRVAFFSGIILATGGEYFRVAHWVVVDSALTFFIVCGIALFVSGYFSTNGRKKFFFYVAMYIACTFAFYSKGFIGIVLPGLGVLVFLIIEKNVKEIFKMRLWLGILIFLAMTLPWFLALWQQGGTEYLKVFLFHNHLQRFLPASLAGTISEAASGHHNPFYYYITEFPNGFLPWSILLIPVLFHMLSKSRKHGDNRYPLSQKGTLLAKCWFFAGIIFLSIASTKRTLYLMPVFAPMAMLTASYIDFTLTTRSMGRIGKSFAHIFSAVLLFAGFSFAPAYFYFRNSYSINMTTGLLMLTFFVSGVIILLALMAIRYLRQLNLKRYWIVMNIAVILALIFIAAIVLPVIDQAKSFVPFCKEISARVPPEEPLYAYQPDETLRGAVPFYTGRFMVELNDVNNELLQKETPYFVMIRDRKKEQETQLISTGRLFPIVRQEMGTDRALVIFSNKVPQTVFTIETPISGSISARQQNSKNTSFIGNAVRSN